MTPHLPPPNRRDGDTGRFSVAETTDPLLLDQAHRRGREETSQRAWEVARWIIALALIPPIGWAANTLLGMRDDLTELRAQSAAQYASTQSQIQRVADDLDAHQRRGGAQGHPESVFDRVSQNEGRLREVERRVDGFEGSDRRGRGRR